jgi:hypothetical protein
MLNALLDWKETRDIFTPDVVFNLKALLISKYGSNFRNDLAHGFIGEAECHTVQVAQIWWLILRLCYTIFLLNTSTLSEFTVVRGLNHATTRSLGTAT